VDSRAAVLLTTRTLAELERNPGIGKAEALRRALLSFLAADVPDAWLQPRIWAPFSLVGEGDLRKLRWRGRRIDARVVPSPPAAWVLGGISIMNWHQ
jgi:hypothetical protein